VSSTWSLANGTFELTVVVPPNTRATVRLPGATAASVTEGGKPVVTGNGIAGSRQDGTAVVIEVGSGQYQFSYPMAAPAKSAGSATR
jgi:alpha-L-rhamnosidase